MPKNTTMTVNTVSSSRRVSDGRDNLVAYLYS